MVVPFRWDFAKPESLGRLVSAESPQPNQLAEIRQICARIVAYSGEGLLVFVGRSPESFFDYLSGVFHRTSWDGRCEMLNVSLYWETVASIRRSQPQAIRAIRAHFQSCRVSPDQVIRRHRPTTLVDFVASGTTLGNLTELLLDLAREDGVDTGSVKRKLRYVALIRSKAHGTRPSRWEQEAQWPRPFPTHAIKNISLDRSLWSHFADHAPKVANHHPPQRWDDRQQQVPPRQPAKLAALNDAVALFRVGTEKHERRAFARRLSELGMRQRWVRSLIVELNHSRALRLISSGPG